MSRVSMQRSRSWSTSWSIVVAFAVVAAMLAAGCGSSSHSTTAPPAGSAPSALAPSNETAPTSAAPASTAPPVACARPHPAGQTAETFTFQGEARTYQLYVPRKYTGTKNVPVVFDFHGFGSNAVQQMVYGNYKPEADRDDFLIVAPDGQDPANRHFNLTVGEGPAERRPDGGRAARSHRSHLLCRSDPRVLDGHVRRRRDDLGARLHDEQPVRRVRRSGGDHRVRRDARGADHGVLRNRGPGRSVQRRQGELLRWRERRLGTWRDGEMGGA